jgi:uncharacterized membrane protein YphA (DoxX/SURF4 family)
MPKLTGDLAALLLRVTAGLIFLPHGWSKVAGTGGAAAFAADIAANYNIPAVFGYVAAYAEVAGAVLLIAGLLTRLDAFLLACTMFVAAFVVQLPDALFEVQPGASKLFVAVRGIEMPLAMFAICVALMLMGGGRMSLDHLLRVDERAAAWLPRRRAAARAAAALLVALFVAVPVVAADDDPEVLIRKLKSAKDTDELERVVDRIATAGDADGSSTAAVKKYLLAEATPKLIAIAEDTKAKWSLRGSAIHALRDMGAPRDVLERVAEMALKDSNEFVKSRGEILANYLESMPEESETEAIRPTDPEKERAAIAFLEERNLGVSLDQLRLSAIGSNADEVQALIDAGVDVNAGPAGDAPLVRALSACAHDGGENEEILKTVDVLLKAGADVKELDDNRNTPLISAAQYCSAGAVLKLLEAGADPNATNGSGVNPLAMALIMSRLDAAEALVSKGAKLNADQVPMASSMANDDRARAIIKKASKK